MTLWLSRDRWGYTAWHLEPRQSHEGRWTGMEGSLLSADARGLVEGLGIKLGVGETLEFSVALWPVKGGR